MSIRVALIGTGGIALRNHLPGFKLCPQTELVALCDSDPEVLQKASQESGIAATYTDYRQLLEKGDVDAVVIATPNVVHHPIALAAISAGKHVLCEKPLGMDTGQTREMVEAAERAGIRHMTAFTYRFVPAMRYMKHLVDAGAVGQPYHFRANRFQDFGDRFLGWRQFKDLAGSGELGDMLSHRIDYGHYLLGPITRVVDQTRRFLDQRMDRHGQSHPSEVDDWVAIIGDFECGATGVFESSKLATGRGMHGQSQDYCEINGSEGTLVYYLHRPHELLVGRRDKTGLETAPVPVEFLTLPGSPRNPHEGDPDQVFRYDQDFEFVDAIRSGRPCQPSFHDGMRVQAVIDAALESDRAGRWVEVGV